MVEDNQTVAWNVAQQLIQEISKMRSMANINYLKNKIFQAYLNLHSIRMNVVQNLNKDERESFSKIEMEIDALRSADDYKDVDELKWGYEGSKKELKKFINKWATDTLILKKKYEEYNTLLMDVLEKYGYLVKKAEDLTKMKA